MSRRISLYKAFTWRAIATCATMLLVYIGTGHLALAAVVGAGDIVLKILLYYLHERAWVWLARKLWS